MFAKMSLSTETNTSGVPCEDPSVGVKIGVVIRELEITSGARSLIHSVEPVDRRISEVFPVVSPEREDVNSGPV